MRISPGFLRHHGQRLTGLGRRGERLDLPGFARGERPVEHREVEVLLQLGEPLEGAVDHRSPGDDGAVFRQMFGKRARADALGPGDDFVLV